MAARLPADDPRPQRRAARLQRRREQFRYNYNHVEPLAIADQVPESHAPSWDWWALVLDRGDTIMDNIRAIRGGKRGAGDNPGVENRKRRLQQIRDEMRAGKLRESRRRDGADDEEDDDKRSPVGARIAELLGTPWQKVLSDLSDQVAIGAIDGRANTRQDFEALFQKVPFGGESLGILHDERFAWLRVAGPNPTVIRRAASLPPGFRVTEAQLQAVVKDPEDSLARAAKDDRLYLCDYTSLAGMKPGTFPVPKVVAAPLALFVVERAGARRLLPVAIQCRPAAAGPVFGPGDGWAWQMSKLVVQVADGNHHEAVAHLGRTHLFIEPFVVATERQLDEHHPIYRLLRPHFEGTLFINNSAHSALIAPGGTVDRLMSGTIQSSRAAAAAGLRNIPFNEAMLDEELASRKVRDPQKLPEYPYRDDALLHWKALTDFVGAYLRLYYPDDATVQGDPELQAWAAELVHHNGGRVVGFGEPSGRIRTRAYLVRALTLVIFTASVQHAAVNIPQYEIMSNAANYPLGLYAAPPDGKETEADYLAMLPNLEAALVQLNLGYLLGSIHYTKLGQYEPDWFGDERVRPLIRNYQEALRDIGQTIEARNETRRHRYPYLHPAGVPQSINI